MRKGKYPDPDPYFWLMDLDPDGPKTCGSSGSGSGSPTLVLLLCLWYSLRSELAVTHFLYHQSDEVRLEFIITEASEFWQRQSTVLKRFIGSPQVTYIAGMVWTKLQVTRKRKIKYLLSYTVRYAQCNTSVADPDPHVFGPPGSGSISQRYGSGSGSFSHQAKIVRKPWFLLFCDLFLTF